jgi:protein-S-isoprenylcysteine O-methyltransferase Ste14
VPIKVVTERKPARGSLPVWIAGTLVAIFWPAGVFLVPAYAYHWPAFPDFEGSWVVQVVGAFVSAGGGVLYSRSAQALGKQMTPAIQVRQGHELVERGPYRFVRHPVYTAIVMIALGQSLLFLSMPLALLALLLAGLAVYRSGLEEALLRSPEAFGSSYDAYVARTGRFLPRLRSRP